MTTWAIGDVHGCWVTLLRLLKRIDWHPDRDRLWLVGDLVNRGPNSLEVLRWAYHNRERLKIVLGNHDLHLLARAAGVAKPRAKDTLDDVLAAPDCEELLDWLRTRPLIHHFGRYVMVHAGLAPQWSIEISCLLADLVSTWIGGEETRDALEKYYLHRKLRWGPGLDGDKQLAAVATTFTHLRMVGEDGRACLEYKDPPRGGPAGSRTWFDRSAILRQGYKVIFGHWAQLGYYWAPGVVCLDSGCVYGGSLSAGCLNDGRVVHEPLADEV